MRSAKSKLIHDPNTESSLKFKKDRKMMMIINPGETKADLKTQNRKVKFATKFSYENPIPVESQPKKTQGKPARLLNQGLLTDYASIPIIPRDSTESFQPGSACTSPATPCLLEAALTLGPSPSFSSHPKPSQRQPPSAHTSAPPHDQQQHEPLIQSLKAKVRQQAARILQLQQALDTQASAPALPAAAANTNTNNDDEAHTQQLQHLTQRLEEANVLVRRLVLQNERLRAAAEAKECVCAQTELQEFKTLPAAEAVHRAVSPRTDIVGVRDAIVQTEPLDARGDISRADFEADFHGPEDDELPELKVMQQAKELLIKHLLGPSLSKLSSSQDFISHNPATQYVEVKNDIAKNTKGQTQLQTNSSIALPLFEFVKILVDTLSILSQNIDDLHLEKHRIILSKNLDPTPRDFAETLTKLVHTAEDFTDVLALMQFSNKHLHSTSNSNELLSDIKAKASSLNSFLKVKSHKKTFTNNL